MVLADPMNGQAGPEWTLAEIARGLVGMLRAHAATLRRAITHVATIRDDRDAPRFTPDQYTTHSREEIVPPHVDLACGMDADAIAFVSHADRDQAEQHARALRAVLGRSECMFANDES